MTSELASAIPSSDIPQKLRCAICDTLAVNAFRLFCCEDSICETCHSSLGDTCPKCSHNPIAAADCKPNKALRNTVKAFLKSEEKKREKAKAAAGTPREQATSAPDTSIVPSTETVAPDTKTANQTQEADSSVPSAADQPTAAQRVEEQRASETVEDVNDGASSRASSEADSVEIIVGNGDQQEQEDEDGYWQESGNAHYNTQQSRQAMPNQAGQSNQNPQIDANFMGNGWNNPAAMMNMMAMQNGMNFNNFNPMMAMGMTPMMMGSMNPAMFGDFGGQFGGMNGMGMGAGFGGGYGGDNWGMNSHGNFGANAGRYPRGGYNTQSHRGRQSQMQNQQFPVQREASSNHRPNAHSGQDDKSVHEGGASSKPAEAGSDEIPPANSEGPAAEAFDDTREANLDDDSAQIADTNAADSSAQPTQDQTVGQPVAHGEETSFPDGNGEQSSYEDNQQYPSQTFDSLEQNSGDNSASMMQNDYQQLGGYYETQSHGFRGRGSRGFRGGLRGGFRGRGGFNPAFNAAPAPPPEPIGQGVVGAPTGPKAMREGRPNVGWRGRGGYTAPARGGLSAASATPKDDQYDAPSQTEYPKRTSQGRRRRNRTDAFYSTHEPDTDRGATPRSDRRDEPMNTPCQDTDQRHDHQQHSNSHRSETDDRYIDHGAEKLAESPRDDYRDEQANPQSTPRDRTPSYEDEGRTSRHEKDRHRSSRHGRDRSHERSRRHRHRSRSPDRDRERERDYDREHDSDRHRHRRDRDKHRSRRDKEKERDRDRERRHERRHEASVRETPDMAAPKPVNEGPPPSAPTGPRGMREKKVFKIQGISRRDEEMRREADEPDMQSQKRQRQTGQPDASSLDPYAQEREARMRERLLKEQQRRGSHQQAPEDSSKRKRGYEDEEPVGEWKSKKKRHRKGRGRSGLGFDEDDETRAARVENEREAARWG